MATDTPAIDVLFHAGDRHLPTDQYIVHYLAEFWREAGCRVRFLFGCGDVEPADLLLLHVNLSVVPDEYLAFAARYPMCLNAALTDIRKSRISCNLIREDDPWTGPVIVKSELNYAGRPEQMLHRSWLERNSRGIRRLRRMVHGLLQHTAMPLRRPSDYAIYPSKAGVPASSWANSKLVVEKFLPETEGGLYFTRVYQCLGDQESWTRMGSRDPIVKANNSTLIEPATPHEQVRAWRQRLGMDYGKLDYVVHDGVPVLLDVNKTIGASVYRDSGRDPQQIAESRRKLAQGVFWYLREVRQPCPVADPP